QRGDQRGFSRPGRTHDHRHLAVVGVEGHVLQHLLASLADLVRLADAAGIDCQRAHRSKSAGWLFFNTPTDMAPDSTAMPSSASPTGMSTNNGKSSGTPEVIAMNHTSAVNPTVSINPAMPTQKLSSMTTSRSRRIDTPSARRLANSLMLARIAPCSVCQVITT